MRQQHIVFAKVYEGGLSPFFVPHRKERSDVNNLVESVKLKIVNCKLKYLINNSYFLNNMFLDFLQVWAFM